MHSISRPRLRKQLESVAATIHRAVTTSVSDGGDHSARRAHAGRPDMAWFETGTLNYADRADANASWNPAHSVDGVTEGPDRPALSPDGLRIVVVKADRHGFAEYVRSDRLEPTALARLRARRSSPRSTRWARCSAANEWFGSPVLSGDDRTFVYLRGDAIERAARCGVRVGSLRPT